ncbi:hypothetical protein V8F20_009688 [Naviculisporaceae sp. PSN 640]
MPTIPIPLPVPASVLVDRELARRRKLRRQQKRNILTGCREIDDYVLLGGFERGCVVGISSEDDEMGLLLGLQTVAHLLVTATLEDMCRKQNDGKEGKMNPFPRVTIVTMLPVNVLVPKLRQILVNQLAAGLPAGGGGGLGNINILVKQCLRNIAISMVFDVEGLREVLGEIAVSLASHSQSNSEGEEQERRHTQQPEKEDEQEQVTGQDNPTERDSLEVGAVRSKPVMSIPIRSPAKPKPQPAKLRTEIRDSEDEDEEEDESEDEGEGKLEDLGNVTDSSSELSSPPASLPDEFEFEEYEKLLQDNKPLPKQDGDIPDTVKESSTNNNDNPTKPRAQADDLENRTEERDSNGDSNSQAQTPSEKKDDEPSGDTEAQPQSPPPSTRAAENSKPQTYLKTPKPPANIDIDLQPSTPPPPDMILITHMTALMNGLFTGRDKPAAHETMAVLSSQLRQLTSRFDNCPSPSPVIMILNSTTTTASPFFTTGENNVNANKLGLGERPASRDQQQQPQQTTADPTLRSIFQNMHTTNANAKTKPSFGTVFSQLLDLHLLCTRIPRRQQGQGQQQTQTQRQTQIQTQIQTQTGPIPFSTARGVAVTRAGGISSPSHIFAWVVEVLLDERGVYEYDFDDPDKIGEGRSTITERQVKIRRRCREQRWGAVEVEEGGGRIVDVVV